MLVGRRVLGVGVVRVVGGDRRDAEVLGQPQQAVADPGLDRRGRGPSARGRSCRAPKMSWKSPAACAGLVVVADAQPGLDLARRAAGGARSGPWRARRAARGRRAACRRSPRCEDARGEPEQVVHALGGLGQQRHVGVGAAAGDVVVAAVVPAHPLAVEARGVGGEVGLHADDRLDPGGLGLGRRSRRRRTRCRGRSSRSRPCRARRCGRTSRRAGPRRRAWSTRCARAGGRRSPA